MIASAATVLGDLLVTALLVFMVVMTTVAILMSVWLCRRVHRFWNLLTRHVRGQGFDAPFTAGLRWLRSTPIPDRRWRSIHGTRRRMSRALIGAEHAIELARSGDAPLGDLGSLCRRLHETAANVDRSLRIAQRSTGSVIDDRTVLRQADSLTESARLIQFAAAKAVGAPNDRATDELADDLHREAAALASGIWKAGL